ncbi:hypothetical protein [Permianibacter aggregans]|uniref:Uncharacterized protein n=1 Tax=Permianibacter aggregans TaxID=1510150 RepID=A0A4R6UNC2_9GAMM|nr:hypothetical protein [Permianibacter aggregans]QGX40879.1 hypothetical protein E2H98_14890 [Permianibacter aggregans]TDQ48302.1 hypothetical protein EV696_10738 [Permianibacter aggregans]
MQERLASVKSMRIIYSLIITTILSGCVSFAPTQKPDEALSGEKSYVYGQFYLEDSKGALHMNMGLIIENLKTKKRTNMPFSTDRKPTLISLEPGEYKVKGLVYASATNNAIAENMFPPSKLTKRFLLEPGKAYYLIDMHAKSSTALGFGSASQSWTLESIRDNFTETTNILRSEFRESEKLQYVRAL